MSKASEKQNIKYALIVYEFLAQYWPISTQAIDTDRRIVTLRIVA